MSILEVGWAHLLKLRRSKSVHISHKIQPRRGFRSNKSYLINIKDHPRLICPFWRSCELICWKFGCPHASLGALDLTWNTNRFRPLKFKQMRSRDLQNGHIRRGWFFILIKYDLFDRNPFISHVRSRAPKPKRGPPKFGGFGCMCSHDLQNGHSRRGWFLY